jgi:hypothetical protein
MSPEPRRPINHLCGTRSLDAATAALPAVGAPDPERLALRDVEIHYCLMEMPLADAVAGLPPSLHPSIPGHLAASFYRVPDSPCGPFELAVVGIGCRAGIRPRILTTSAFVTSAAAASLLRARCGFDCAVAEVRTRSGYHGANSSVTVDGRAVLALSTSAPEVVIGGGAAVKYPAALNLVRAPSGATLLQVDIGYEYKETTRGTLAVEVFDPQRLGLPGKPSFPICGTRSVVDMEVHPWRTLIDIRRLAEDGGTSVMVSKAVA